jgi:hypothetical protein
MTALPDVSSHAMARARWRPSEIVFWILALACAFLFPSRYLIMTDIVRLALFALSLDLILGYAGIVSLGGPFPNVGAPLAELNAVRTIPLFVAASRQGRFFPTDEVCDNLRLFHSAGMSITLREYPGGDGLSPQMLADVDRWIMEQIASSPAPTSVMPQRQSGVN